MKTGLQPDLREFPFGSSGYEELVRLRDIHLRRPIGLGIREEDIAGEESQRHFALIEDGRIIGGLIAAPLDDAAAKLRQMWIDPAHRGRQLGRYLLDGVEGLLFSGGIRRLALHAREEAVGFYEKCGYHPVGGIFAEVGIPHRRMEKAW